MIKYKERRTICNLSYITAFEYSLSHSNNFVNFRFSGAILDLHEERIINKHGNIHNCNYKSIITTIGTYITI